jgi:hypothetical protein
MTDDHVEHDDDVPEGYSKHHVAFCRNDGSEESKEMMKHAMYDFIKVPVVVGEKLPEFEASVEKCENGCCLRPRIYDTANDQEYGTQGMMPAPIAVMTGSVHPDSIQAGVRELSSILN